MAKIPHTTGSFLGDMSRVNSLIAGSLVEPASRVNSLIAGSLVEPASRVNSLMSVGSVLTDLWPLAEIAPAYIPARHLGSGPFQEDTEQDDTDSLMVIRRSDLHPDVLMACGMELSNEDYFHAVLEAIKGLLRKIRLLTGLTSDGNSLIEQAFAWRNRTPHIALSKLNTTSERNVQEGFMRSLTGIIFMYRNPLAHESRATWPIGETEAILVLSQISDYHRRIDSATIHTLV